MRAYILQVLQLTAISLPTIFVEKSLSQFQLCALNVVRCLFSKYPSHRQLILQDICSSLIKLPCGKRNLRTYPSSHGGRNIQMWVALVMQLLQCCALSDDTTSSVAVNAVGEAACAPSARLDLTMEEARKSAEDCAKMLVLNIVNKCNQKAHYADYRPVLENLVEDVACCYNNPLWPASELVLQVILKALMSVVVHQPENEKPHLLRLPAIQLLGVIGAQLRIEIKQLEEEGPPFSVRALPGDADEHLVEDVSCVDGCHLGTDDANMLDCDRCHIWFHGECVGMVIANAPEVWYCGPCRVFQLAEERHRKTNHQENYDSESYLLAVCRHALLFHLEFLKEHEGGMIVPAINFWLSSWSCATEKQEDRTKFVEEFGPYFSGPSIRVKGDPPAAVKR